jgi:hypothetical protein
VALTFFAVRQYRGAVNRTFAEIRWVDLAPAG